MQKIISKIAAIDWITIAAEMHDKGYAIVPKFISDEQCEELQKGYDDIAIYRKTVVMERY